MSERMTRAEMRQQNKRDKRNKKRRRPRLLGCLGIILFLMIAVAGVGAFYYNRVSQTFSDLNDNYVEQEAEFSQEQEIIREEEIDFGEDAISILLLGIDTEGEGSGDAGRSDIMIVATINPNTDQVTVTTIPRDTYVEIPGRGMDKINHAYAFGGNVLAANTVQGLLDIPIDYTFSMNMSAFVESIDLIGGVDVVPTETFQQEGYSFQEGVPVTMNGDMALAYIRNRQTGTGDYGRQARAEQVVGAVANEIAGVGSITQAGSLIQILQNNVVTNLTFGELQSLALNFRDLVRNVEVKNLQGTSQVIDGIYYEMISDESLAAVQQMVQTNLGLE